MNRQRKTATGLVGLALLLGSVAAGCAGHGGNDATSNSTIEPNSTPSVAQAAPTVAPTATLTDTATPLPSPTATDTPASQTSSPATASTPAPVNPNPTTDPLDSELQTVNQLVDGVGSSISSSTGGGGE